MKSYYILNRTIDCSEKIVDVECVERSEIEFIDLIINEFTCKYDQILDPFAGMGTILKRCELFERIPFGIEIDKGRFNYIQQTSAYPNNIFCADSKNIAKLGLPLMDVCFTSPPFSWRGNSENPLSISSTGVAYYSQYLEDLKCIFLEIKQVLKPHAKIIIDTSNVHYKGNTTSLAWDTANVLKNIFDFKYEIIMCWENRCTTSRDFLYEHSYCLIFENLD